MGKGDIVANIVFIQKEAVTDRVGNNTAISGVAEIVYTMLKIYSRLKFLCVSVL